MQEELMQNAVRAMTEKRFRGHKTLKGKINPRYRANLERDFVRTITGYTELVGKVWKKYTPVINEALKRQEAELNGYRADKQEKPLYQIINDVFDAMSIELDKRITDYNLAAKIGKIADLTKKLSIADWKLMCHATLGIDLFEDYYNGRFFEDIIPQWVYQNVDLIKTIPKDTLQKMRTTVENGFYTGARHESVAAEIEKDYRTSKSHAKFIARDQMAKLNGTILQKQQRDAGVTHYIWVTCDDQRVRDSHKHLNGKMFSWDDPPIVDEKTGRRCHPMQDYQCRCTAKPVFNIETLNLPIKGVNG